MSVRLLLLALSALLAQTALAQTALAQTHLAQTDGGYRTPPPPIAQIVDAAPTPQVLLSADRRTLAVLERETLPSIAAVSEPILRLAGYRINPRTNGPIEARTAWLRGVTFKDVASGRPVKARLPEGLRFTQVSWSPDGRRLAFVAEVPTGLELWVVEAAGGGARRLTGPTLNAAFGQAYAWTPDSAGLIARMIPAGRGPAPRADATPTAPIIQENVGRTAPARTYQDLLTGAHDEALFDHHFTSQLTRIDVAGAREDPIGAPAVWASVALSPDGRFLLTERLKRPYSYIIPAFAFPTEVAVLDMTGQVVRLLADRPLADDVPPPFDAVVKGPREASWRADAPATLVWAEAQDGGDPRTKVAVHDRLYLLEAPFTGQPRALVDLEERYATVLWGRDDAALVISRWFTTRNEKRLLVNPSSPGTGRVLISRNYQDQYGDPGAPVMERNAAGHPVMRFTPDGAGVFLIGPGATARGEYPFLARLDLADGKTRELWRSADGWYEAPVAFADAAGRTLITRRESKTTAPNFALRTLGGGVKALTSFPDPAPQFAKVSKQLLSYTRADGLPLSGTLYLPAGYDPRRDGPLPTILWAYPSEFTDAKVAGQVVDRSANRFTRPGGISHLFLLTQGYAVLDDPAFPIVGVDGKEANDTYIEQLQASAQAAVDAVVALGVADRSRMAVGGHSYGAFMTANLLAHTDLFKAGIARSGAYNRTLTPFGFQAEQRTYWEATDTYTKMSPFTFAPQIKEPVLLIHGAADDNTGTFPVQSERMYAALKGAGATVRYVVLPNEAHAYRARESTLHTLWEMTRWLDQYVKPKGSAATR